MFPIQEIDGVTLAFGASRTDDLMPAYADIPREFKQGTTKWNRLFADWFYSGLSEFSLTPREGVDQHKALRHIKAVMTSFQPKHEHKEAGVAYLLDQWFSDGTWTRKERQSA